MTQTAVYISHLGPRHREVLGLMAKGMSNTRMAREMFIGAPTVARYVGEVYGKLGLGEDPDQNARVQAVLLYQKHGENL